MKIFYNPSCSKSRSVLTLLLDHGIEPEIIDYLKTPPTKEELAALVKKMNAEAGDIMRWGENLCDELNLKRPGITQDELLAAMADHPILINRPIVESKTTALLCRPPEKVKALIL